MPPNANDSAAVNVAPEGTRLNTSNNTINTVPQVTPAKNTENYELKTFQSSLNLLAHILIGATVGISILFSFRNGIPMDATSLHILLCVIGYQLLMSEAILCFCPYNGWSSHLRLFDKKLAHTILQVLGSALAVAGSFIKILDKEVHWNTYHGQFALVALVFTTVGLFNGVASFFAYNLRKCIPGNLSKLSHICFGIVAFATSTITLCYGFDKVFFQSWATPAISYTIMGFSACYTFIIITNPAITFFNKSVHMVRNRK